MYECDRGKCKAFYDKSFVIITESFTRDLDKYSPKIEVRDRAAYAIFKLADLHFGTVAELKRATSREILQMLNYVQFKNDVQTVVEQKIKRENEQRR